MSDFLKMFEISPFWILMVFSFLSAMFFQTVLPEYDPPEYTSAAITKDSKWADREIIKYCYMIFFFYLENLLESETCVK